MTNEPITWYPTNWILLEQTDAMGKKMKRLLSSLNSRYSAGEGWRLSNEIKNIKNMQEKVVFRTYDNEIYFCKLKDEGFTELMQSRMDEIHDNAHQIHGGTVEVIDYTGAEK